MKYLGSNIFLAVREEKKTHTWHGSGTEADTARAVLVSSGFFVHCTSPGGPGPAGTRLGGSCCLQSSPMALSSLCSAPILLCTGSLQPVPSPFPSLPAVTSPGCHWQSICNCISVCITGHIDSAINVEVNFGVNFRP